MSHQTVIDQLRDLRLPGMVEAYAQQVGDSVFTSLPFEKRVQMLIEAEASHRDTARYHRILKLAKLKFVAAPEDVDYGSRRNLDKTVMAELLTCSWIGDQTNVLITGATGTGKTWLACALAVQAARKGISVTYRRVGRLLEEMASGHEDGTISRQRSQLARMQLLLLDDFGLSAMSPQGRSDLLEILDDRVGVASTIVMGQMPVKEWHGFINDPAVADAILDRVIHSSAKIELRGESMRQARRRGGQ